MKLPVFRKFFLSQKNKKKIKRHYPEWSGLSSYFIKKLFDRCCYRKRNMHISYDNKYQKSSNEKINQGRQYFTIQYSLIRKVFNMLYSKFYQNRLQKQWGNKVFNQSFNKCPHFGRNKQSDSDTENIVLSKKSHKIFEHLSS